MKYISISLYSILLQFSFLGILCIYARVEVHVMNDQENEKILNLHCQSKDDDLGYHIVGAHQEYDWRFTPNLWGTTLFYCDVQLGDDPVWYHWDAYDGNRDWLRCQFHCRWSIHSKQYMFGYDETNGYWELFPLKPSEHL